MGRRTAKRLVSVKDKIQFLQEIDLFINIPEKLLQKIAPALKEVALAAGDQIIKEGDIGDCMYFVYKGVMNVHKEAHILAEIPPKSIFGELSLLTNEPRLASITAKESSILLRLDQADFYKRIGKIPEVSQAFLQILVQRLNDQNEKALVSYQEKEEELKKLVNERTQQLQEEKKKLEEAVEEIQVNNLKLRKANKEIIAQKEVIELKNRNITQSIVYASKIQNAILGEPKQIIKHFKRFGGDAFVFFKPKEIVSGDFYWYTHAEDRTIIIVADCTGHGVPGAFMTMMGSALLNETINERRVYDPAKILYELDTKVTKATSNTTEENSVDDGMNTSVLVIDQNDDWLHFAGAKCDLFHITDPVLNLSELIKGDRNPIGKQYYTSTKRFSTQHIKKVRGDVFYLFTNGFQDQEGGEVTEEKNRGKKYMAKRFRELLITNSNEPMEKQKQMLEQELENWQQDFEQTDDILVMGVKV